MTTIAKTRTETPLPAPTVLRGVRYGEYVRLRDEWANRHLRMVYHDGTLEIMSPESTHEISSRRIGLFIFILSVELEIECHGTRSTTFRKGMKELKKGKGKEPDESFYFGNAPRVIGKDPIHLDRNPPADLWIDVDHRASSQGGLPLYAALGVPEVWRYRVDRDTLWFGELTGLKYRAIKRSLSLPMLTPALILEALDLGKGVSEPTWNRRLQPWIRENLGPAAGKRS
jgi:Uma2 family endonuclease